MTHKRILSSFIDQDDPQTSSENNGPHSPLSGNEYSKATTAITTSPSPGKKGRKSIQKRVVSVPIGEIDGSRSSTNSNCTKGGESYPPSDSWAWRKYGQKPIKGSPYPRGYYRCSSSKGCPARKQVERSRVDPTTLIITYAFDHNHPALTSKHHHHQQHNNRNSNNAPGSSSSPRSTTITAPTATNADDNNSDSPAAATLATPDEAIPSTTTVTAEEDDHGDQLPSDQENEREKLFADPPDFEMGEDSLLGSVGRRRSSCDFSWLSDVSFDVPSLVGPRCDDAASTDFAMFPVLREEEESLFADLGELPECSAVFRHTSIGRGMERCKMGPSPPLCGSTG